MRSLNYFLNMVCSGWKAMGGLLKQLENMLSFSIFSKPNHHDSTKIECVRKFACKQNKSICESTVTPECLRCQSKPETLPFHLQHNVLSQTYNSSVTSSQRRPNSSHLQLLLEVAIPLTLSSFPLISWNTFDQLLRFLSSSWWKALLL